MAHAHAAGRVHGTCAGSVGPRSNAAAPRMSAMLAVATAASHDIQNAKLTPPAGGAMPRPK